MYIHELVGTLNKLPQDGTHSYWRSLSKVCTNLRMCIEMVTGWCMLDGFIWFSHSSFM